jgi:hypothetical protein
VPHRLDVLRSADSFHRVSPTALVSNVYPPCRANADPRLDSPLPDAGRQVETRVVGDAVPVHDQTAVLDCFLVCFTVGEVKVERLGRGLPTRAEDDAVPFSRGLLWEALGLLLAGFMLVLTHDASGTFQLTRSSQLKASS